ncbi:nicotinate-nucleotide adenylyltransferase [Vannielia litorea]|uniref:nicotinate-nucleotide adenylyltransferase n=1 Tax=Vannielia litorea TaxID=1217970 RepID=UPI001C9561BD|nr:nicotinate-nucleotide adenylyltransferase [Vannielia litorea]MBY6048596.1 nicotinate-nucleotide adenylyltransferase [Vannielia litorea]MBY6076010.1 nicotinate-nucleotide adenylyltransferase [Vannielia litorea]
MRWDIPYAAPGQAVGLLGGSFDPAHEGHVHVTREALKRFGLDAVWWLVSPGNPLKARGPAPLESRIAEAQALVRHPLVTVSGIEARLGTRYTAETLAGLQRLYPRVRFTWLMGADNLAQFHRWDRWQDIMATVPVGVIARPGQRLTARMSKTAQRFAAYRLPAAASHLLPHAAPPAWCFINIPMSHQSSTAIRAARASAGAAAKK